MIKAVIFDLDGTLIRLPIQYEKVYQYLGELFQTQEEFKPLIPSIVKKSENDKAKLNLAFEFICKQEEAAISSLEIIDNAVEILNYLHGKKITTSLVTMQCRRVAQEILSKIKASSFFSTIITRDEYPDRLEQINRTLASIKIPADQTLVVGDRLHDMECAIKANCHYVLSSPEKAQKYPQYNPISNLILLKDLV